MQVRINDASKYAGLKATVANIKAPPRLVTKNWLYSLVAKVVSFLALTDSTGAAVPTGGHTQPLQISPSAAAPQFTFNVTGKLN